MKVVTLLALSSPSIFWDLTRGSRLPNFLVLDSYKAGIAQIIPNAFKRVHFKVDLLIKSVGDKKEAGGFIYKIIDEACILYVPRLSEHDLFSVSIKALFHSGCDRKSLSFCRFTNILCPWFNYIPSDRNFHNIIKEGKSVIRVLFKQKLFIINGNSFNLTVLL